LSASSFDEAIRRLLSDEGGNDDDPVDRGGRTSRGVTQHDWDRWRKLHPERNLPTDVWKAPKEDIHLLYKTFYWDAMHCDQLPAGVDYAVFDYGVNSGIGRAPKVLQGILGVLADGHVGNETMGALARANPPSLINAICDERMIFVAAIVRNNPSQARFINGWRSRITRVRSVALQLWKQWVPPVPAVPPKTPGFLAFLKGLLGA
jgi:lysozyme family protein